MDIQLYIMQLTNFSTGILNAYKSVTKMDLSLVPSTCVVAHNL